MNYFLLLQEASKLCHEQGKEDSAAKLLLMSVTNMDSSSIIMKAQEEVDPTLVDRFRYLLHQYVYENIPVQHLTNIEYFYGRDFFVNEDVLIPRFETEELVSNVLMIYDEVFEGKDVDVVDVGTGSGAIAITLDLEEANMHVSATDISEDALGVAKRNAETLGATINFYQGDMLEPLTDKFDILVSNPPYIPEEEYVDPLVKDNEPHVALFGGTDGMDFYKIIIEGAARILKPKSILAFEHAYNKNDDMKKLAETYFPNAEIRQIKDLQGKDRMTFIINR